MQINVFILFLAQVFCLILPVFSQQSTDTSAIIEPKAGWNTILSPLSGYDIDIGVRYGGFINLYDYGNGNNYPRYDHYIYAELSNTTKGSGIVQLRYDSEALIPGIRITTEAAYLTEKALDFYGFNGNEVVYNRSFVNDNQNNDDYISRMYYKHDRQFMRLKADFQGRITGRSFRWLAGFAHYGMKTGTVNIDQLNEGKKPANRLPDTTTLFENYIDWGIIPGTQKNGGNTELLRTGLIFDTRDNEPNPGKGLWDELLVYAAPGFLWNDYSFIKLILTHRQYFTLIKKRLNLAYRLSYQPLLSGEMPFYMLPFVYSSFYQDNGLGGKRTLRGIIRNRLVGNDYAFGNIEMRCIVWRFRALKQNVYIAGSSFLDAGTVTSKYKFKKPNIPQALSDEHFTNEQEELHLSAGFGSHLAINHNFILSLYIGFPFDKNDGEPGAYTTMGFLF